MDQPSFYHADAIKVWATQTEIEPGRWVLARPIRMKSFGLLWRISCAWKVFCGKADVLVWAEDLKISARHK